jgi:hypothetical protein
LLGFEAISSLLRPFVATDVYQGVLRQSIKRYYKKLIAGAYKSKDAGNNCRKNISCYADQRQC